MSAGLSGVNSDMAALMQILMQGMTKQADMAQAMVAANVENQIIADKMAIAQQIIDVYA